MLIKKLFKLIIRANGPTKNSNIGILYICSCKETAGCLLVHVYVNESLLFSANSAIFQVYHGENKLIFNEMMLRSAF